eukprot:13355146-Alexandrium_andersonii.AAC.1
MVMKRGTGGSAAKLQWLFDEVNRRARERDRKERPNWATESQRMTEFSWRKPLRMFPRWFFAPTAAHLRAERGRRVPG